MDKLFFDIERYSKDIPWLPAIIDDNSVYSFHSLKQLVDKASQHFLNEGLHEDNRVGLLFSNSAFHLIASLAILRIGACQLSFDAKDSVNSIDKSAKDCRLDLIISDKHLANLKIQQLIVNLPFLSKISNQNTLNIPSINSKNIALLSIGSGTTGEPKIIPLSFKQLNEIIYERKDFLVVKQGDRFLSLASYNFHVGKLRTLFALSRGLTNIFLDKVNAQLPIFIERLAVSHLYATDAHAELLLQLLNAQEKNLARTSSPRFPLLKALIISGSPLSPDRIHTIRTRLSSNLYLIYACNETSVATMADPALLALKPNSVGIPIPECLIEIVSKENNILPLGEIGHIRIQAKGMVQNYENNQEASQISFIDGWFYPKDLGRLDEEGVLYFEGRSDDLIFFDGVNVFPREIELILDKLSDVEEAAAFPVKKNGKIVPAVCIQLTPDSLLNSNADSIQYFSDCLKEAMGWKRPRVIHIVDKLPRNKRG